MRLNVSPSIDHHPAMIAVDGAFDYGVSTEFRDALEVVRGARSCVVDLANVTYVDSSALGMLLILKEQVGCVSIVNCGGYPRRVFDLAGFDAIFDLD